MPVIFIFMTSACCFAIEFSYILSASREWYFSVNFAFMEQKMMLLL